MRAYIWVTAVLFCLIVVAHVARVVVEHGQPLHEPVFVAMTLLAAGVGVWGLSLTRRRS